MPTEDWTRDGSALVDVLLIPVDRGIDVGASRLRQWQDLEIGLVGGAARLFRRPKVRER